jgi:tripartite ATP-independent transporter DctM subunit
MASGNIPGSLAVATLATCALFATATGIVGAVVTLMGLLAFPAMLRAGYDVKLASGVVAAGGCLGILIPPSIMLILFGATAGVSVVQLYAAAFIPGVMLAGLYILYAMGIAIVKPEVAPRLPPDEVNIPFSQIAISLLTSFIPLALLIAMVLGAILMGLATPSEAAAMGSLGSIILAIAYRSFSFAKLKESVFLTARTSAMVCWLFVGSAIFSSVFGYLGGQELVEQFFKSLPLNTFTFMILAQLLIFILGWPLEWTEIIVIFVPIFLPLLDDFGVDPLFFGVMVALNLQTSFLSPPVAMAAFYLKGVAPKHVRLEDIFKGCMPFIYIVIMCMLMIYAFPGLVTWLPEQLYGSTPASGTPIQLDAPPEGGFQEDEALKIAD